MSDNSQSHFRMSIGGVEIELSGDRAFVEDMYSRIAADLEPVLNATQTRPAPQSRVSSEDFNWIYSCDEMVTKVYSQEASKTSTTGIGRYINPNVVRRIYLDTRQPAEYFGLTTGQTTLWAEFTEQGRQVLKDALHDRSANK